MKNFIILILIAALVVSCAQQQLEVERTNTAQTTPEPQTTPAKPLQTTPELDNVVSDVSTDIETFTPEENNELDQLYKDLEELETIDFG